MVNKRLIHLLEGSFRQVQKTVLWNFLGLLMNLFFLSGVAALLTLIWEKKADFYWISGLFFMMGCAILLRAFFEKKSTEASYYASCEVKKHLRSQIYQKLLRLGSTYQQQASTAEIVQMAMEGVDQLEIYFSRYLPQLFISLLTPLTLFAVLVGWDWKAALVLLLCVPLIPLSIIAVQKLAKKLLSRYWGGVYRTGRPFFG